MYLAQHSGTAATVVSVDRRLRRPLERWGDTPAGDVRADALKLWLLDLPISSGFRYDLLREMRAVYSWAMVHGHAAENPAKLVAFPLPVRSERIRPFDDWPQLERVAAECGRWAPLVILAADCGARPGELSALEHRHVDLQAGAVFLPGTKTANARRTVFLRRGASRRTGRSRDGSTRLSSGRTCTGRTSGGTCGYLALELAGVEHRRIYDLRHSFAVWSLSRPGAVPGRQRLCELGHANVTVTFQVYGAWRRDMGERAAGLRAAWAAGGPMVAPDIAESP